MPLDAFISYSSKDQTVADMACAKLEEAGIRCWIAHRDEIPGSTWAGGIVKAIEASKIVVLVLSQHSNLSPQVLKELSVAANHELTVVPFKIDSASPTGEMAYHFQNVHWLDAVTPPVQKHLDRLVDVVQRLIGGDEVAPPPPAATPPAPAKRSRLRWAVPAALALAVVAVAMLVPATCHRDNAEPQLATPPITTPEPVIATLPRLRESVLQDGNVRLIYHIDATEHRDDLIEIVGRHLTGDVAAALEAEGFPRGDAARATKARVAIWPLDGDRSLAAYDVPLPTPEAGR